MLEYYAISEIGLKREKNQDSYCSVKNKNGDLLLMVCDGIGGGKAGEVASGETVKYFIENFKNCDRFSTLADAKAFMKYHINKANQEVYRLSCKYKEFFGMGTTLTALLVTDKGVLSCNVGDSRIYGYADGKSFRLTVDHTLVNEMIQKGEITYEESLTHPKRHYLVRAIGVWDKVEADIHQVANMDYYLVCSDGLSSYVQESEITKIMINDHSSAQEKCQALTRISLLKGGYDNITIIVLDNNG